VNKPSAKKACVKTVQGKRLSAVREIRQAENWVGDKHQEEAGRNGGEGLFLWGGEGKSSVHYDRESLG